MRNLPEERLKRRQSDKRKDTIQRIAMWTIIAVSLCIAGKEFITTVV